MHLCWSFSSRERLKNLTLSSDISIMLFSPYIYQVSHLAKTPYSNWKILSNKDEYRLHGTVTQVPITPALGLVLFLFQKKNIVFFSGFSGNIENKCGTFSFHLSSISHPLHNLNSKCGKPFEKNLTKEWGGINVTKQNKSPPICFSTLCDSEAVVIQGSSEDPCFCIGSGLPSRNCSPFFCCTLWVLEPAAFQSLYLWMGQVRLTLLKPKWENPLTISFLKSASAALLRKMCSLSRSTSPTQDRLCEEVNQKKVWHQVDFKCHLPTIILM